MGLFKKVKDILFDEEEYTEQIKITPEMRNEPVKEEKKEVKVEAKPQIPKEEPKVQSEKEVFKNNSFPFLDFDEEEFDSSKPPADTGKICRLRPVRYGHVFFDSPRHTYFFCGVCI